MEFKRELHFSVDTKTRNAVEGDSPNSLPLEQPDNPEPPDRIHQEELEGVCDGIPEKENAHVMRVSEDVLDRGRETRPTAPVPSDSAEAASRSEGICKAMHNEEVQRCRETRPAALEHVTPTNRRVRQRTRGRKSRESGPSRRRIRRRRSSAYHRRTVL